jgi:ADP-ribosylglycohydrolase
MRSALLGVCLGDDQERLRAFVRASTRLTHTDPRAERGALLVALAAHHGSQRAATQIDPLQFLTEAHTALGKDDAEMLRLLDQIEDHLTRQCPPADLMRALGQERGVSGYVYRTVPAALYGWLRQPGDFRAVLEAVIPLGGDSDTTGAIAGALAGASAGARNIPQEWVNGLLEWPRSVSWMHRVADRLAEQFSGAGQRAHPVPLFWPGLLPRNLLFLAVVLGHVGRRLLPPYR